MSWREFGGFAKIGGGRLDEAVEDVTWMHARARRVVWTLFAGGGDDKGGVCDSTESMDFMKNIDIYGLGNTRMF